MPDELSFTQQIFNTVVRLFPAFTDEFSNKYVINTLAYNYATGLATATLSHSDYLLLKGTNFTNFTFTDIKSAANVVSASWNPDLSLSVTFDKTSRIAPTVPLKLEGFLPVEYNTTWIVQEQVDSYTYKLAVAFSDHPTLLTQPPITQLGYYLRYSPGRGFNGLKTVTFDDLTDSVSFPVAPENIVSNNGAVYTLSGGQTGAGYIHNWHNNIFIGKDIKFYQQALTVGGKNNMLFVVTNDWEARPNQEKFNILDTAPRQDSRKGNILRMLYTFYLDYFINVTNSTFKSNLEAQNFSFFKNVFYKLNGLNFEIRNTLNPDVSTLYNFATGEVSPLRSAEDGDLLSIFRYSINLAVTYSGSFLLDDGFSDTFDINEADINMLPNNNNFQLEWPVGE